MAHIQRYKRKNGTTAYEVNWVDPAKRERSKTFSRSDDAKAFRIEIERELLRGTYVDPDHGKITFREYAAKVLDNREDHRDSSARMAAWRVNLANEVIGNLPIGAARRNEMQSLIGHLSASEYKPSTVHSIMQTVGMIFTTACDDDLIKATPCRKLKLPEIPENELIPPTDEEMTAILSGFRLYRDLCAVDAGCGLRSGEIRGLTEDRVNWLHGEIRVNRQLIKGPGGRPIFGPPKTKSSFRTVPVSKSVMTILERRRKDTPKGGYLFLGRDGQPITEQSLSQALRLVFGRLGYPKGTGLHLFRHYYASMLIENGLNVKEVQKRLGHKSATVTLDIYGHLWPDTDDRTRDAVDATLGPILAGLPAAGAAPRRLRAV